MQLEGRQFKQWAVAGFHLQCHMCTIKQKCSAIKFQCERCETALNLYPCFRIYHTEVHSQTQGHYTVRKKPLQEM